MALRFKKFIASFGLLVMVASMGAQAAPYFTNKKGDLIWDKATGLVWMRCNLGQTWNGKTCSGDPKTNINFYQAKGEASRLNERGGYGGHKDWQVPTIRQLASLITCSTGPANQLRVNVNDGGSEIIHGCPKGAEYLGFDPLAFPRSGFNNTWTSSECTRSFRGKYDMWENCSSNPLGFAVDIAGEIIPMHRDSYQNQSVRLVRLAKLSAAEAAETFVEAVPHANAGAWSSGRRENHAMAAANDERRSKEYARQQQSNTSSNQAANNVIASRWAYKNHQHCATSGDVTTCTVSCSNDQGSTRSYSTRAFRTNQGHWSGPTTSGLLGSMVAVFQDFCSKQ